jgi:hypothetical protein
VARRAPDNPFRDWVEESEPFGAATCAAYIHAHKLIDAVSVGSSDMSQAETGLRGLVTDPNAIDAEYGLIDTINREQADDAFFELVERVGVPLKSLRNCSTTETFVTCPDEIFGTQSTLRFCPRFYSAPTTAAPRLPRGLPLATETCGLFPPGRVQLASARRPRYIDVHHLLEVWRKRDVQVDMVDSVADLEHFGAGEG